MNNKTFIAAVVAALSVTITLAGCGASNGGAAPSTTTAIPSTTDAPPDITAEPATTVPSTSARPTGLVDEVVAVHGAGLHVHCDGVGPTTVVLIAGFNADRTIWALVEPTVAQTTRVCSYDRFGTGTSDAPPQPQTFTTQADDLHAVLQTAGEPGAYVVVGHSFGGAEAVTFASMFPVEVRGLLLLDASPPAWNKAICAVADDGTDAAHVFQALCAERSSPANNAEHLDAPAAFAAAATITTLDDFPISSPPPIITPTAASP